MVLTYDKNCRSPTTGAGSFGRITLMINGTIDCVFQEGRFQASEHVSHVGFFLMWKAQIKSPYLRPLKPLYKRVRRRIHLLLFLPIFLQPPEVEEKRVEGEKREKGKTTIFEVREQNSIFLHYPDFIKGSILLRLWANRPEIWRRCSWLIDLQSERWRSNLEFRTVVFQSENRAFVLVIFLSEQFWSWTPIKVNMWFDWANFWWVRSKLIDLHSKRRRLDLEFRTVIF